MSLSPQLPNLPDEEDGYVVTVRHELPAAAESAASVFRFSWTRLIIATVMAPLPLLLIHRKNDEFAWCLIVSCFTLFGTILWTRAEAIPRMNTTAVLILVASIFLSFGYVSLVPFAAILCAIPAILVAQSFFPSPSREGYRPADCSQVLQTAILPFVLFGVGAVGLARLHPHSKAPWDSWGGAILASAIVLGFVLLLAINIYWSITDRGENLRDRPDLGYRYEATMVLIPFALMVFFTRLLQG